MLVSPMPRGVKEGVETRRFFVYRAAANQVHNFYIYSVYSPFSATHNTHNLQHV